MDRNPYESPTPDEQILTQKRARLPWMSLLFLCGILLATLHGLYVELTIVSTPLAAIKNHPFEFAISSFITIACAAGIYALLFRNLPERRP